MDQLLVSSEESTVTSRVRGVKRLRGLGYVAVSVQLVGTAELFEFGVLIFRCVAECDLLSTAMTLICTVVSYHESPDHCMLPIG
jgi:hypothetical protein